MDLQEKENYVDYNLTKYDMKERINFDIPEHIDKYTEPYSSDTRRFLYSNLYLKKKRRVKRSYKVVAFVKNAVQNEYTITVTNERKLFFEINTGIVRYYYKKIKTHPFTSVGRLKKKILFESNETYYLTHKLLAFRTLTCKMLTKQIQVINFMTFSRYLNKILFFTLIHNFKAISFKKGPLLIRYKYKKKLRLFSTIGYQIRIRKIKLKSLSIKRLIPNKRYKRYLKYNRKKFLRYKKFRKFKFLRMYNKQLFKYYKMSSALLKKTSKHKLKRITFNRIKASRKRKAKKAFLVKMRYKPFYKVYKYIINMLKHRIKPPRQRRILIIRKGGKYLHTKLTKYTDKLYRKQLVNNDIKHMIKTNKTIFRKFAFSLLKNYRNKKSYVYLRKKSRYSRRRNFRCYKIRKRRKIKHLKFKHLRIYRRKQLKYSDRQYLRYSKMRHSSIKYKTVRYYKLKQKLKYSFRKIISPKKRLNVFERLQSNKLPNYMNLRNKLMINRNKSRKKKYYKIIKKIVSSKRNKYLKFLINFKLKSRRMARAYKVDALNWRKPIKKLSPLSLIAKRHLRYYMLSRRDYSKNMYLIVLKKIQISSFRIYQQLRFLAYTKRVSMRHRIPYMNRARTRNRINAQKLNRKFPRNKRLFINNRFFTNNYFSFIYCT